MKKHQFHSGLAWTERDGQTEMNKETALKYQQAKEDYEKRTGTKLEVSRWGISIRDSFCHKICGVFVTILNHNFNLYYGTTYGKHIWFNNHPLF